ncbi:MAG: glycosyltransferase family 39 protein, partial [Dehalococcoidia bacterium]|nr:glycosyltransferase family 39 protein [Dehalococcoidia bacterium]
MDWALLVAITLLAAATRFPGLEQIPPGLWRDEAGYALAAEDIRAGVLRVYWGDKEPFFPYVLAAVFTVVGAGVAPLRATAAFFGVGAVALTFLLGRALFGRTAAVVAAIGMAVAFWPLDLSRVGFRVATMPF